MSEPLSPTLMAWAEQMALSVAADEVDLAPLVLEAYLAGGDERTELFSNTQAPGASFMGGGESLVFAQILFSLMAAGSLIMQLIESTELAKDALNITCNTLTLTDRVSKYVSKAQPDPGPNAGVDVIVGHTISLLAQQMRNPSLSETECNERALRALHIAITEREGTMELFRRVENERGA